MDTNQETRIERQADTVGVSVTPCEGRSLQRDLWSPDSSKGVMRYLSLLACMAAVALTGAVKASSAEDAVKDVLEHGRAHCRSISNGEFFAEEGAVTQLDVTGDGVSDQIVDASRFACSTAVTPYCGTGGCPLTVIVNDELFRFQAQRWKVIHWGEQPVLLLQVHSAACESNNWQPCIKAMTWSEGSFHGVVSRP